MQLPEGAPAAGPTAPGAGGAELQQPHAYGLDGLRTGPRLLRYKVAPP